MTRISIFVLLILTLGATTALAAFENGSVVGQVPDRIMITVAPGVTLEPNKANGVVTVGVPALDALSERFAVTDIKPMYAGMTNNLAAESQELLARVYTVDFPAEKGLANVLAAFGSSAEIVEIHAVDICKMYDAYLPNDPGIDGLQWYLRNMSLGAKDIRAIGGWNNAPDLGDTNLVIAIIDSGVDWQHPDLGGTGPRYARGAIWINWAEYHGIVNVDDDGNGFIDDERGWDWVHNVSGAPGEDVMVPDNDPMDFAGHGTACAGCAAAITDNEVGIAGTAPGCKIMALRAGWLTPPPEEQGVVRMDFVASAMIYGINNGAKIFNCSWGSHSSLSTAVATIQAAGGLIVTAAGNDDSEDDPSYLNTVDGILSVAATGSNDGRAGFSNYGDWVEIAAPGVGIYTTSVIGGSPGQNTYTSTQGTSFSSPITCGAAALLWSVFPSYDYLEISDLLMATADDIDHTNPGYEGLLGAGRVNLLKPLGDDFHKVPTEFPTLLDALNEADTGETVAVLGGSVLTGGTTIHANELQVLGGWDPTYTTRDPIGDPVVLQGDAGTSALQFTGPVTALTVVDGFRCENGGGKVFSSIPVSGRFGGGIAISGGSPTLRNIEVTNNSVGNTNDLGGGGGILLLNSDSVLENVNVYANSAHWGSGVYVFGSDVTFIDCAISDNSPATDNATYPPKGGGLAVIEGNATLTNCSVNGHLDYDEGGAVFVDGGSSAAELTMRDCEVINNSALTFGGGIVARSASIDLAGVVLQDNTKLPTSTFMNGGGLYAQFGTVQLDSLEFVGNDATLGGGLYLDACTSSSMTHSVLIGNSAGFFGGAVGLQDCAGAVLSGNTVAANTSTSGSAGFYISGSSADISNNIVAFNTGGASFANGMYFSSATATLACNDVFGNEHADYGGIDDPTGSDGNISADPDFCNVDVDNYHVTTDSPCAPAHSGGCGLIGALSAGCGEAPVPGEEELPLVFKVEENFPNPFNPLTTIRFSLPQTARTSVSVYDLKGYRVRTLLDEELAAAVHDVQWDGTDAGGRHVAAGVYFYRVISGEHEATGRMALIK